MGLWLVWILAFDSFVICIVISYNLLNSNSHGCVYDWYEYWVLTLLIQSCLYIVISYNLLNSNSHDCVYDWYESWPLTVLIQCSIYIYGIWTLNVVVRSIKRSLLKVILLNQFCFPMSSSSIDTSFFLRMGEGPEGWGCGFENSLVVCLSYQIIAFCL